ncbi:undecaprenyldiphospho-muramoylpentapeptide beta-N-acetylglucosaminyltransferase [soil metagenome]
MRLALTGGGTGGHIYPALEVGRHARSQGDELLYLGSLRGMESAACKREGVPFQGFPSEPLWSLKTPRGWKSLIRLLRARGMARRAIQAARPDAIFSTGGYSAGPVMAAARSLGVPYTIHEANSVSGRSNLMFAPQAKAFTATFRATERFVRGIRVDRTGQPIRAALRKASHRERREEHILVVGGSQGSAFLNGLMPEVLRRMPLGTRCLHVAGRGQQVEPVHEGHQVREFLQGDEMAVAYARATVVVARSGGSCAEFALFGLPSVLIPLPASADDHQLENAREFEDMGAATILWQTDDTRHPDIRGASPEAVAESLQTWIHDVPRREAARHNLGEWDVPDATERIYGHLVEAARS